MIRKALFSLCALVAGLALLEGGARLFELALGGAPGREAPHGWQATFFSELFDWHEPDPDLLWRFRAGLDNPLIRTNNDHLIGDELRPKAPGAVRVVVLGDSSPVGLGLPSYRQTFATLLEQELVQRTGREVQLINAAVSGYTSEQVRRFLEIHGRKLQPDAVVLYCGNNDASVSGPYGDQQLLEAQRLVGLRRALSHLAMYRVLRALLAPTRTEDQPGNSLVVRVPPERYAHNLRAIADLCETLRARLYICEPPVPLLWPAGLQFKIFRHVTDKSGEVLLPARMREILQRDVQYCLSPARFQLLYGDADRITRAVYSSAAVDTRERGSLEVLLDLSPDRDSSDAVGWNNLGVQFWTQGAFDSALVCLKRARTIYMEEFGGNAAVDILAAGSPILFNTGIVTLSLGPDSLATVITDSLLAYAWLDSALQADYFSLRIKREYTKWIRLVADEKQVTRIDLPALFSRGGGETLFVDHCHPVARGHQLIADALADEITADLTKPNAD
ncbi:MAG: GDSL-type esterase/lipase family protein [candidate division Zixibacteria bacterium]|jgi:lysophospholipase L1-like esterase|nr:GDSL-type esterase/lipase family protein [candidate division Zixibacteria bacterium]